jgi:hypothetical protein
MRYVDLLTELSYQSYKANRDRAPHVVPERWREVYPEAADAFEVRYRLERRSEDRARNKQRRRTDGRSGKD